MHFSWGTRLTLENHHYRCLSLLKVEIHPQNNISRSSQTASRALRRAVHSSKVIRPQMKHRRRSSITDFALTRIMFTLVRLHLSAGTYLSNSHLSGAKIMNNTSLLRSPTGGCLKAFFFLQTVEKKSPGPGV